MTPTAGFCARTGARRKVWSGSPRRSRIRSKQNPFYTTPTRPATNAGLCLLRAKDEKGAAAQFAKAYTLDPSNTVALFNLAELAYKQGDFNRARGLVTELNQRSDVNPEIVWLGLRIERKLGHQDAMESYAQKLKGRFPDSQQYQDYLAGNFE
ncbi:tetratricopeptide repeat protein [Niveibacterium sp. SC-1]|uniref:tetratricopeptide repeat protein n=1 Tax=Niveibacterium sp. SC-1 TaxID=3135646 RepID=UPI00311D6D41